MSDDNPSPDKTDALTDILRTIRLNASAYFCSDFKSPWGMAIDYQPKGLFHVVVEGSCCLQLDKKDTFITLEKGDIVAFPTGGGHVIRDSASSAALPGAQVLSEISAGGNPFLPSAESADASITLLCGSFQYDWSVNHPFLKDLPCFIHIQAKHSPELAWLRALLDVVALELRQQSAGAALMIDRLTEVLFIQLIRFHINHTGGGLGYITALADKQIGIALNHIHSEQGAHWTVERLGQTVAMSRTAFTEKFTKLVGMPPKNYLINWRMNKAKAYLQEGQKSMADIAQHAGYASEASFSKAFKQFFGDTPGSLRPKD
ncbi:MAG: hypothetical protein COA42_06540 [Alteromonadaceae bacterium]|nr:MAG: hypothetical protein COA42_06540 [Alteromonadaceae bacterium]